MRMDSGEEDPPKPKDVGGLGTGRWMDAEVENNKNNDVVKQKPGTKFWVAIDQTCLEEKTSLNEEDLLRVRSCQLLIPKF
jgi:hypothetical protein